MRKFDGEVRSLLSLPVPGIAISLIPLLWLRSAFWLHFNDDAYITLTYAKCLAAGKGFVFNALPTTLGTTTPLFALCVGFLGWLARPFPVNCMGALFCLLCWVAVVLAIQLFHRVLDLARWEALVVGAVLVSHFRFYAGGEATMFQCVMLAAILLFLRRRHIAAGVAAGMLFLVRGEGALLLPAFGVLMLLEEGPPWGPQFKTIVRQCLCLSLGFCMVFGAWAVYAHAAFGGVFPNTLRVKMMQGHEIAGTTGESFLRMLAMETRKWDLHVFPFFPKLRSIFWALALFGVYVAWKRRLRFFLLLLIWVVLYIAVYALLNVPGYCYWYRVPVYWIWNYSLALGLLGVVNAVLSSRWPTPICRAAFACLIVISILGLRFIATAEQAITFRGDSRAEIYQHISHIIKAGGEGELLATFDVGYLGYLLDNPILDKAGLVTPGALPYIKEKDVDGLFRHFQPKYDLEITVDMPPREETLGGVTFTMVTARYAGNYFALYQRE